MIHRIIPAIMSGGAGTRLWPLSTEAHPKQFHTFGGEETLFAATVQRVSGYVADLSFAPPLVLCNARHIELVRENLNGPATLVLEPMPRNTAAVAAIAAALAAEADPDALVLLTPADHIVRDAEAFYAAIARAAPFAREHIVAFGITPDRAATGYGYIKSGALLGDGVFAIEAFKEKPDFETARTYLESGDYAWNAGVFLFHPRTLLAEFSAAPDIRDAALAALAHAKRDGDVISLDAEGFARVRSDQLDVAVMEKTSRAAVAPCDIGWADIGSWDEVYRLTPRDARGFARLGPVASDDVSKITSAGVGTIKVGTSDLVAIAGPYGIIFVPRDRADDHEMLQRLSQSLKICP